MKLANGKSYHDISNYLVSLTHEDHLSKTDVKKIKKKRFNILKKSMELEEPFTLALLKLADCYLYGNGTKQNFKKAQEIYLLIRDSDQSLSNHIAVAQIKLDALNHDDPLKALDEYIDDFESELDDDDPLKILSDLLDEEEDGA